MFFTLFSSKNHKLVLEWTKEHKEIVFLATRVISEYSSGNYVAAKIELINLQKLAIHHLMTEDLEFYDILHDEKGVDKEVEKYILNFQKSFQDVKPTLMQFLTKYIQDDEILDEVFFFNFKELVATLAKRIEYEEKNLYKKLDN